MISFSEVSDIISALKLADLDPLLRVHLLQHFGTLTVAGLPKKVEGFFVGVSRDIREMKRRVLAG